MASCKLNLNPWQKSVVDRVASTCRDQFGVYLYHRMGAGKTLSLYSILHNFPPDIRRVVFAPASIISSTYTVAADDLKLLYGDDPAALKQRLANFVVRPISRAEAVAPDTGSGISPAAKSATPEDYGKSLEEMLSGSDQTELVDLCQDAIVSVDEVHNVISLIRAPGAGYRGNNLLRAFGAAKRLILMSGTPIMRNASDISLIMAMVAPHENFPIVDSLFFNEFYAETEDKRVERYKDMTRQFINNIGTTVGKIALQGGALKLIGFGLSAGTAMSAATILPMLSLGAGIGMAGGFLAFDDMMYNHFMTIQKQIEAKAYMAVDPAMLLGKFERYISYFDYTIDKSLPPPRYKFPRAIRTIVNVDYTHYQLVTLLKMAAADNKFTRVEEHTLGLEFGEDIADPAVYRKYACRLGDITPDCEVYGTHFKAGGKGGRGGKGVKWASADQHYAAHATATGTKQKRAVFECPKYQAAVAILARYYQMEKPHMVNGPERFAGLDDMYALDEVQCPKVEGGRIVANKADYDKGRRFLPIVYSSFERTFQEFSAYLDSLGLRHFVFLGNESSARRQQMIENVVNTTYPIGDVAAELAGEHKSLHGPVCAIIHPSIIEGLSLTFNPCLISLDTIEGYGVQEQVYGRVLRTLKLGDPAKNVSGEDVVGAEGDRIIKMIYQLRPGYRKNDWIENEETPPTWVDLVQPVDVDQKYVSVKNYDILQTKLKNNHFGGAGTAAYSKMRGDIRRERYMNTFHAGRGGGFLARQLGWVFNTAMGGAYSILNKQFENTRWRFEEPSPELLVVQNNEAQAEILDLLGQAFSNKTDADIAAQYCMSFGMGECKTCLSGSCGCDEASKDACPSAAMEAPKKSARRPR